MGEICNEKLHTHFHENKMIVKYYPSFQAHELISPNFDLYKCECESHVLIFVA